MTKGQRFAVLASAVVTCLGGVVATAHASQQTGSCGIIYGCADEPGCQFGPEVCERIREEHGNCSGTYQTSWCSLVGCEVNPTHDAVACVFS